jgi:hypothetical protein
MTAVCRSMGSAGYRPAVTGRYFGGIGIAGAFTLLPPRIMNAVVFTGHEILPLLLLFRQGAAAGLVRLGFHAAPADLIRHPALPATGHCRSGGYICLTGYP